MEDKTLTQKEPEKMTELEKESIHMLYVANETEKQVQEYYNTTLYEKPADETKPEVKNLVDSLQRTSANLVKVYITSSSLTDELKARWKDWKKSRKKRLINTPANGQIDIEEQKMDHFAKGLNIYKLIWLLFIGSFAGVIVESLWCILKHGYLESRAGLVYGPFNLLYGVGAIAISATLYKFRNHGSQLSFLGGMLAGSIVEYICSWGQELIFGSRSWDYSEMPLNINGRICLLYSFFWGFLGILWMKRLYPQIAKQILKIPNRIGKILSWVILAFFIINASVSFTAVYRWSQRTNNIAASNGFWQFVDKRFPDTRMEKIYPNMSFGNNQATK